MLIQRSLWLIHILVFQDGILHKLVANNAAMDVIDIVLDPEFNYNVNLQNEAGETALMVALENNNEKLALFLMDKPGVDLFVRNKFDETCLHVACRKVRERSAVL